MLPVATVLAVACVYRFRRSRRASILDVRSGEEAETFVRLFDRGTGIEDLVERIARVFEAVPPTEAWMRRMSMLQRRQYPGTARDFACTVLYGVATDVLRVTHVPPRVRRVRSAPT